MSNKLLLSNKFKIVGWCILIPAIVLGLSASITNFESKWPDITVFAFFSDGTAGNNHVFSFIKTDITNTVIGVLFIIGAMFVGFSKEKREDEFIANLRVSSLLWAVWVNYALLLLAFVFVYGTDFLTVMMYNMFTVMIIFIGRFNFILYKNSKAVSDEK